MQEPFPHGSEVIELRSPVGRPRVVLWRKLKELGFKRRHQIWRLPRTDEIINWQSENIVSFSVYFDDKELSHEEKDREAGQLILWNRLELSYLLATLPEEHIEQFANTAEALAKAFDLTMYHRGDEIDATEIKRRFRTYADFLTEEYSGPGSKTISQFITFEIW